MKNQIAFSALVLFASVAIVAQAEEIRGKVVSIADGDTVTVLDANNKQHKIRLDAIDAPEKSQPFGEKSKDALGKLVHGKDVVVQAKGTDKYGRTIGTVLVGNKNVNEEMLKSGMAWHYKQFSNSMTLATLEVEAKKQQKGLWIEAQPTPPWRFREKQRLPIEAPVAVSQLDPDANTSQLPSKSPQKSPVDISVSPNVGPETKSIETSKPKQQSSEPKLLPTLPTKKVEPVAGFSSPKKSGSGSYKESDAEKVYEKANGVEVVHKKDGTTYERKQSSTTGSAWFLIPLPSRAAQFTVDEDHCHDNEAYCCQGEVDGQEGRIAEPHSI